MASIKVKLRNFGKGFNPSVIFEGRATQLVGPLMVEKGEQPRFVQLYVHDSNLESGLRFKNMVIPANMSHAKDIGVCPDKDSKFTPQAQPICDGFQANNRDSF